MSITRCCLYGANDGSGSTVAGTSSYELRDIRNLGNPVAIARLAWRDEKTYRISPEFRLDYDLLGTDDSKTRLRYTGLVYMDIYSSSTPKYWPAALVIPASLSDKAFESGSYNRNENYDYNSLSLNTKHTMTYTPHFKNEDWYLTMMLRGELTVGNNNKQNVVSYNTPNGINSSSTNIRLSSMSTGNGEWRSMSALYSTHLSYKGRYALDFSLRADGTTKFGDSKKWGYFPDCLPVGTSLMSRS